MSSEPNTVRGELILGYTTRRHLILDLDNTGLDYAISMVSTIMAEWPKVGDCLVLRSSTTVDQVRLAYNKWGRPLVIHDRPNYHLVFDNLIGYNSATRICRVLAGLGVLEEDYDKIREFRGDMTLRVSQATLYAGLKPVPEEAAYIENPRAQRSDGYIGRYRKFKKIGELLALRGRHTEGVPYDGGDGAHDDT
ncbi:unnamed protein product [marine sediment metagenome]|uniref:Uncharacterized protein n=1 Tax=marine sediment metagenome TaxID=412755 RepID=X1R707_9ZZZZ